MARNLGFSMILSSVYGSVIVLLGNMFLLFRIPIEEEMLLNEFGEEYEDYRKKTKKLIPYIY
jgi:protein-S-isoprenylcysteine O-methyltransferase Ste14